MGVSNGISPLRITYRDYHGRVEKDQKVADADGAGDHKQFAILQTTFGSVAITAGYDVGGIVGVGLRVAPILIFNVLLAHGHIALTIFLFPEKARSSGSIEFGAVEDGKKRRHGTDWGPKWGRRLGCRCGEGVHSRLTTMIYPLFASNSTWPIQNTSASIHQQHLTAMDFRGTEEKPFKDAVALVSQSVRSIKISEADQHSTSKTADSAHASKCIVSARTDSGHVREARAIGTAIDHCLTSKEHGVLGVTVEASATKETREAVLLHIEI
jgi:hypothetical protein